MDAARLHNQPAVAGHTLCTGTVKCGSSATGKRIRTMDRTSIYPTEDYVLMRRKEGDVREWVGLEGNITKSPGMARIFVGSNLEGSVILRKYEPQGFNPYRIS